MRSFAILLSLQCIYNDGVVGFSPTVPTMTTSSPSSTSSLFAIKDYDDIRKNTKVDDYHHPLHNKIAKITATLALGLTIGTSSGIAYDNNYYSPNNAEIVSSNMMTSSSVQLSASYSDSDFADFSLPSYQDVTAAEVNSNLSGGKDLLGDEFKTFSPTSGGNGSSGAPEKKEPSAADIKAEKAAAKAAQKAARERQQAAVEAAAAANK